jgi:hypothetical protein
MMHLQVILSVCMLSFVSCFKADSDFPDPNVERSMSLRHPAKGEFDCFLTFIGFSAAYVHLLQSRYIELLLLQNHKQKLLFDKQSF